MHGQQSVGHSAGTETGLSISSQTGRLAFELWRVFIMKPVPYPIRIIPMSLVVPFDDSALAKAALVRARQFDQVLDEGVIAVSVIPAQNVQYARKRGWIGDNEPFDGNQIVQSLRASAAELAPDAQFEYIVTHRSASSGTIAKQIRRFARDNDATIVFIGSENAGRFVHSLSVGSSVASSKTYDTMIISQPDLPEIRTLEQLDPSEEISEDQ